MDAWHFDALIGQAQSVPDPETRMDRLARAVDQYRGALDGCRDSNPWVVGYAGQLHTQWIDAVATLGRLTAEAGRFDQSEMLLQQALTLDDSAEPIYQGLMATLARQDRVADALLAFDRCRGVLAAQGLEPAADTWARYDSLKTKQAASARYRRPI